MTIEELQDLFTNCPHTCNVSCDYELDVPSAQPSMIPTPTCIDDDDYVSPINSDLGCEFHADASLSCSDFEVVLSSTELEELLLRCPLACDTCIE